ncbi:23 kDa integral membrane protein-like isoform X4 [Sitophilus oryzae]|uniref:Tetraspanin n=1 Tax=Sitophilus oryzae TaxID=7048 RepID=A0A6J2Y7N5_SITOR|nr:23 kDa integral membrane protein-like isoform X3 [Sitophilus oryzae]XP_030759125.1 23 kDa integral membrane protein-like isoform X4 [Sitophilus oryzae]
MGVGIQMMKTVLFIFNIFLTLSGIGIIIAGALILTEMADFNRIAESDLVKMAIAMIVGGAIVTIVAFVGCLGAMRESYTLLMAFAGLLVAIFIMELTVGICAAVFKTDYKVAFKESLSESLHHVLSSRGVRGDNNYYDVSVSRDRNVGAGGTYGTAYDAIDGRDKNYWDVLQRQFKCCGVDGPKDWPDKIRPISCCLDKFCWGDTAVYHQVGCYDTLVEKIHASTTVLVYVGVGIAFVEILGIFLTCWLANAIQSEEDEVIKIHNGRDLQGHSES